jgi:hypothetical protein
MEDDGIVGPFVGSKSREVLLTLEEWQARRDAEEAAEDEDEYEVEDGDDEEYEDDTEVVAAVGADTDDADADADADAADEAGDDLAEVTAVGDGGESVDEDDDDDEEQADV